MHPTLPVPASATRAGVRRETSPEGDVSIPGSPLHSPGRELSGVWLALSCIRRGGDCVRGSDQPSCRSNFTGTTSVLATSLPFTRFGR